MHNTLQYRYRLLCGTPGTPLRGLYTYWSTWYYTGVRIAGDAEDDRIQEKWNVECGIISAVR